MVQRMRDGDAIKPIVEYIEKNLAKGYKIDDLRWALVNQKYSRIEIEKAIKLVEAKTPVKEEKTPQVTIADVKQETIALPPRKGFFARLFSND